MHLINMRNIALLLLLSILLYACAHKVDYSGGKPHVLSISERRILLKEYYLKKQYEKIVSLLNGELNNLKDEKIYEKHIILDMLADIYLYKLLDIKAASKINELYRREVKILGNNIFLEKYHYRNIYTYEITLDREGLTNYSNTEIYKKYLTEKYKQKIISERYKTLYNKYLRCLRLFGDGKHKNVIDNHLQLVDIIDKMVSKENLVARLKKYELIKIVNIQESELKAKNAKKFEEIISVALMNPFIIPFAVAPLVAIEEYKYSRIQNQIQDYFDRNELLFFESEIGKKLNIVISPLESMDYFYKIGFSYENENQAGMAIKYYKNSINILEQIRSTIEYDRQKISYFSDKVNIYNKIVFLLIKQKRFKEAFEYIDRSKSRAFIDQFTTRWLAKDHSKLSNNIKNEYGKMRCLIDQTSISNKQSRAIQIKHKIKSSDPIMSRIKSLSFVEYIPPDELLPIIGNSTIVNILYDNNNLFVICFNNDNGYFGKYIQIERDKFEKKLNDLYLLVKTYSCQNNIYYEKLVKFFYKCIFSNIDDKISDHIIIIPDKKLYKLPFNALEVDSRPLIFKHSIALLPTSTIIKYLSEKKDDYIILLIGDITYNNIPKLPFTKIEIEQISRLFKKRSVLVQKHATKDKFISLTQKNFNILHFAGHAYYNREDPLGSGLIFYDDVNDYILTGYNFLKMNLTIDLIVLSACETGINTSFPGNEIFGLTRPILISGARNIMSSLWEVDDRITMMTMIDFYTNLLSNNINENHDISNSLKNTQIKLFQKYKEPIYWAPFYVTGTGL